MAIFIAGLIAGGIVTFSLGRDVTPPAVDTREAVSTSAPDLSEAPAAGQKTSESGSSDSPESTSQPPSNPMPDDVKVSLPESYRAIVGPPRRRLTFSERMAVFEAEYRDESWALPMEAGINNFVATHAPGAGTVIEHVECRSNWCIVAGYSLPGHDDQASQLLHQMREEYWWQGGNFTSTHGGTIGEHEAFVTMMSRTEYHSVEELQQ